jgi:hypothetical protein
MEHFLQDKAKIKAIAIYTFKNLTCTKEVPTIQVSDALKTTLIKYDRNVDDSEIDDMI